MKKWHGGLILLFVVADIILFLKILLSQGNIQIFNPQGLIAFQQKNLIITYVFLMLLLVIPVIITGYFVAWKYRSSNTKAEFKPDAKHTILSDVIIWIIPSMFVLAMAIITWGATHKLDPTKQLASQTKPLTIQVVSLRWKWLFIYPEQHIATVNFIVFPVNTPLAFKLTADSPMNSFWIPQLGGQMYSMTGMVNTLHLIADKPGDYRGSTAELSGAGFAGMRFTARATSEAIFEQWVKDTKNVPNHLDMSEYKKLSAPSEDYPPTFYTLTDENLYNKIIMQFMPPVTKDSKSEETNHN